MRQADDHQSSLLQLESELYHNEDIIHGLSAPYGRRSGKYEDGNTIDWLHEESAERERNQVLRSQRGIRGLLLPLMDAARMWIVVVATGIGIGIAGALLDVLVKW
jgi:chloride channel 3/4/5